MPSARLPELQSELQIRRLAVNDAPAYRAMRLRAFHDHPEAFTSSYEEELPKPVADAERRLGEDSSGRFWGAFVDGVLAGRNLGRNLEQITNRRAVDDVSAIQQQCEGERVGWGRCPCVEKQHARSVDSFEVANHKIAGTSCQR